MSIPKITPAVWGSLFFILVASMACHKEDLRSPPSQVQLGTNQVAQGDLLELYEDYIASGCTVRYSAKVTLRGSILDGAVEVFNTNGVKIREETYREGIWEGEMLEYHANGKTASRCLFLRGKEQGTKVNWDDEGRMRHSTQFVDGEKQGFEIYWQKDGKMHSRILWMAGSPEWMEFYEKAVVTTKLDKEETMKYYRKQALESAQRMGRESKPPASSRN